MKLIILVSSFTVYKGIFIDNSGIIYEHFLDQIIFWSNIQSNVWEVFSYNLSFKLCMAYFVNGHVGHFNSIWQMFCHDVRFVHSKDAILQFQFTCILYVYVARFVRFYSLVFKLVYTVKGINIYTAKSTDISIYCFNDQYHKCVQIILKSW